MPKLKTAPVFRRAQERSGPLGVVSKLLYAWGEMPGSHMNFAIGGFLLLYYNQILGVEATTVSIAMAMALFLDAILTRSSVPIQTSSNRD